MVWAVLLVGVAVGPSGVTLPVGPLPEDGTGLRWHPASPTVYALTQGDMRVWVDARRLFREEDFTDLTSGFRLRRPGTGPVLVERAVRRPAGGVDRLGGIPADRQVQGGE